MKRVSVIGLGAMGSPIAGEKLKGAVLVCAEGLNHKEQVILHIEALVRSSTWSKGEMGRFFTTGSPFVSEIDRDQRVVQLHAKKFGSLPIHAIEGVLEQEPQFLLTMLPNSIIVKQVADTLSPLLNRLSSKPIWIDCTRFDCLDTLLRVFQLAGLS